SVALTVLSLPSVPEDASRWAPVLGAIDDEPARWLLPTIGWLGIGALMVGLWRGWIVPRREGDAQDSGVDARSVSHAGARTAPGQRKVLQEAKAAGPHVTFRQPQFPESVVKAPPRYPGSPGRFLVVPVVNDPPSPSKGVTASHVRAYLTVTDDAGNAVIKDAAARWQDKPQAPDLSPYQAVGAAELSEMDLPPNGAPHGIDTIVYLRREQEIRLWNQAGLGKRIKADRFTIEIRVRGVNVDESRTYVVTRTHDDPHNGFAVRASSSETPAASFRAPPKSPYARAAELQGDWERKQLRQAMRRIVEDELENLNKPRLEGLLLGRTTSMEVATAQWTAHHEAVREMADPRPYQAGAAA
ncbi:hypothetical protein LCGC14_3043250, partial [marine sediment metagenome]